jgi:dTMP kinase
MKAKFITFEGVDGAGKSSNISVAAKFFSERGIPHILTREPGGTPVGETIRNLLLDRNSQIHPDAETLLLFAARQEHLVQIIFPALSKGSWVICDRFTDATYAYQGGGKGVPQEKIEALENLVHPGFAPDLTLCFDLSPAIAQTRIGAERLHDRFEMEDLQFHHRVRDAYLRRAAEYPDRIRILDASMSVEEVNAGVRKILSSL